MNSFKIEIDISIDTASGVYLDRLAETFGIRRTHEIESDSRLRDRILRLIDGQVISVEEIELIQRIENKGW